MNLSTEWHILMILVLSLAAPALILLYAGVIKVYVALTTKANMNSSGETPPVEILVPVKGTSLDQKNVLLTLLEQEYPCHCVTFIVESRDDPASPVIDELCQSYHNSRKLIAGIAKGCAQKNHNLVYALSRLRPDTKIVVFCDSTNSAPSGWLMRFTATLRRGESEVVTTFRRFFPRPQNLAGVCQTMYGAVLLLLASVAPKPWGGGTAINRDTLEKLPLIETWSKTVVDDLVLGNLLNRAGIKVSMDTHNLLTSPLINHSVEIFINYLDRQILFPKFTNHAIWGSLLVLYVNITIAVPASLWEVSRFFLAPEKVGMLQYASLGFMGGIIMLALCARSLIAPHISLIKWILSLVPFLLIGAFVFVRSLFRGFIEWQGRVYWCGKGGVVMFVEDKSTGRN